MPNHLFVIESNPTPGLEDEYNRWYDEHLVETVNNHPGFVSGRRFVRPDLDGAPSHPYRYVAIYEIAEDQLDEACAYFLERRRDRALAQKEGRVAVAPVTSAMDVAGATAGFFTQVGPEAVRR